MCVRLLLFILPIVFGGCGLDVPQKEFLSSDTPEPIKQGSFENLLVAHVKCQIEKGLWRVQQDIARTPVLKNASWLYTMDKHVQSLQVAANGTTSMSQTGVTLATDNSWIAAGMPVYDVTARAPVGRVGSYTAGSTSLTLAANAAHPIAVGDALQFNFSPTVTLAGWGTAVNMTIQIDEQSGLNPGLSLIQPLPNNVQMFRTGGNVTTAQSASVGIGASATAHSTRTETIQFTYANSGLLDSARLLFGNDPNQLACNLGMNGIMIQSDLKIDQFIYDKAVIASFGNDSSVNRGWPPFSTFQDQITFTASYGGNVTPMWKFARTTVDQNSTLLSATRSEINTLIITLGPLDLSTPPSQTSPLQLKGAAQAQHGAAAAGVATAGSVKSSN
jgi:hypothetical protein